MTGACPKMDILHARRATSSLQRFQIFSMFSVMVLTAGLPGVMRRLFLILPGKRSFNSTAPSIISNCSRLHL